MELYGPLTVMVTLGLYTRVCIEDENQPKMTTKVICIFDKTLKKT